STAADCPLRVGTACRIATLTRLIHGDRQLLRDMIAPRCRRRHASPSTNRSNAACCAATSAAEPAKRISAVSNAVRGMYSGSLPTAPSALRSPLPCVPPATYVYGNPEPPTY